MDLVSKYGKWGLVLGATEGVGKALAEKLAGFGMNVVLVGRREQMLQELGEALSAKFGVEYKVVRADLAEDNCTDAIFAATEGLDLGFVSYVACRSLFCRFVDSDWEENRKMIQVNIITLTKCAHHYLNVFRARGKGLLLNIASASCVMGFPGLAEYSSGKAYVTCLSRCLAYEFAGTGIDVATAVLGSTSTPSYLSTLPEGETGEAMLKASMTPEDTIDEIFERLDEMPCIIVGEAIRKDIGSLIPVMSKEEAEAYMSSYSV